MAITTIDGAIAGFQHPQFFVKTITPTAVVGRAVSLWYLAGVPGAGSSPVNTLNGETYSSTSALVAGQIPYYNPSSGNAYLARFAGSMLNGGLLILADRIWGNTFDETSVALQSITSPTWPARDLDGATSGRGIVVGIEVSSTMGAATPNPTLTYTNSAGTGSRTAALASFVSMSGAPAGSFYPFSLQGNDVGVKSVESIQMNVSWVSGTCHLVAYRVLATLDCGSGSMASAIDLISGGMPRVYDGTVPFLIHFPNTAAGNNTIGSLTMTHG